MSALSHGECLVERLSYDSYRVDYPFALIEFWLSRIRREKAETHCELAVRCGIPGAKTVGGWLSIGSFNLSSVLARTQRSNILAERAGAKQIDWKLLLEEVCMRVMGAEREGQPATLLSSYTKPTRDDQLELHGIHLPKRHPAILFGDGGTLKSFFGLYLAGVLSHERPTLFADWELSGEDHRDRLERLFGTEMPMVYYARCERPLVSEADRLRRLVSQHGIGYTVLDSVAFASDGAPEDAIAAASYFRALRFISGEYSGSLSIAHISKGEMAKGDHADKPFGSVFWHNSARSTWRSTVTDYGREGHGREMTVKFEHKKSNLGPLCPSAYWRFSFSRDSIEVGLDRRGLSAV